MTLFTRPRPAFLRNTLAPTVTLALGLIACGSPKADTNELSESAVTKKAQAYSLWCQEWSLACTEATPNSALTDKLTPDSWRAFSSIALELLRSPSQLNITRADLEAPELLKALRSLNLDSVRLSLVDRLDSLGWSSATLAGGRLDLLMSKGGSLESSSGLSLGLNPSSSVQFTSSEALVLNGFEVQGTGLQEIPMNGIQFTSPLASSLELGDRTVTEVPSTFIGQVVFEALSGSQIDSFENLQVSREQSIASLYPMLSWLNKPSRKIVLEQQFFTATADKLASLDEQDASILTVLRSLKSLETAVQGAKNAASLTQKAGSKLTCTVNQGELTLSFDSKFGIKRFYPAADGGIGLEFFGMKASSNKAFGSFDIKRMELTPENYVILDVPLLGKISIPWDKLEQDSAGKEAKTVCKS